MPDRDSAPTASAPPRGARAARRRLVPAGVRQALYHARALGFRAGSLYLWLRCMRALGLEKRPPLAPPVRARSVLFLCHGNILRSPMAEVLLRRYLAERGITGVEVTSAGLHANPTREPDRRGRALAPEFGVSLEGRLARPLTAEMLDAADLVFVMDLLNEAELRVRFPAARARVHLLAEACPAAPGEPAEIPDPYMGDLETVRRAYVRLGACLRELARKLEPPG